MLLSVTNGEAFRVMASGMSEEMAVRQHAYCLTPKYRDHRSEHCLSGHILTEPSNMYKKWRIKRADIPYTKLHNGFVIIWLLKRQRERSARGKLSKHEIVSNKRRRIKKQG